ncbi:hypothetical protein Aph02nite_09820 [Actinoplanes philippinensis]|uniref:Pectate lyase superfamily protein n=1 Tax=Actinoplanes philippinensis TaxID=35752 RepID=A0A1I2A8A5_9ACTN|nr:glycosyl hydrolase family 28-related protein [Actinoplanes philippinensis]GIE75032.1 hypothetical protein Aph02nite_09820 [Actinoplanes philippinensis]SFE39959.1 Pectate lyase superfamily protein [Actinoplanes philippinensis]
MPDRRAFIRASGVTAAGVAAATVASPTPVLAAAAPVEGHLGLSVKDFGALGDAVTDDTAAVQAALDASPPGGIVSLPVGEYRTSAPLVVPPGVTLQGTHGNHIDEGDSTWVQTRSRIKPLASFQGEACIRIVDKDTGGYPADSAEQRLFHLTLNGSDLPVPGTVDGIQFYGKIHGVVVRDVAIYRFPNHAITTTYHTPSTGGPQALYSSRFERIAAKGCRGITYSFNNTTDSLFTDLESIEGGSHGFFISGCGNSCFTNCRSEWSRYHGYDLRGGFGIVELLGCSTDRNGFNGVNIDANSSAEGVIVLNGLRLNRDGRNSGSGGGGYAGLRVTGAKTAVLISAAAVETGIDDDGTRAVSPQYGVSVDNAACVALESGILRGASAGLRDGGGNTQFKIGTTVITRT